MQYQAFTTSYEECEKANKIFSNDVHCLYSVILKLNSIKLENIDMQVYLNKLYALKAMFTILMSVTKDAWTHPNNIVKFSWSWHLSDYHQNLILFITRFYQDLLFLTLTQLVNNCCIWLHLFILDQFPLHLLLPPHHVTLFPLRPIATIEVTFQEG